MTVVLDTSVVIAGLRSPGGAAAEILRLVLRRELDAACSTALLLEYEAVATRPEHLSAAGLNAEEALAVIDALAAAMEPVPVYWRLRPISPDPDDDFVLEAAFNAGANVLVTNNLRDLEKAAAGLGIRTLTPRVLLSERSRE